MLDEECIRPGDRSDESWLSKMDQAIGQHGHYRSQRSTKDRKMPQNVFVMKHYAGDVSVVCVCVCVCVCACVSLCIFVYMFLLC